MTLDELVAMMDDNDNFLKSNDIPPDQRLHERADLNGFLLLHQLDPGTLNYANRKDDILAAACHDEVFLSGDPTSVAAAATPDDVLNLIRCGVRYDRETESFCMFV